VLRSGGCLGTPTLAQYPCRETTVGDFAFGPVAGPEIASPVGRALAWLGAGLGSDPCFLSRRVSESACSAENRWGLFEVESESAVLASVRCPAGRLPSRPTAQVCPAASSKATGACKHPPAAKRFFRFSTVWTMVLPVSTVQSHSANPSQIKILGENICPALDQTRSDNILVLSLAICISKKSRLGAQEETKFFLSVAGVSSCSGLLCPRGSYGAAGVFCIYI
jgi:hypothetical protein